jgi:DNA-binding Lrp family transcriptional regulator
MSKMKDKRGSPGDALELIGLLPGDEEVYRGFLRASGTTRLRLSEGLGLPPAELDTYLGRFVATGLVRLDGERVVAEPPAAVLGAVVSHEAERLRREGERVDALRDLLPALVAEHKATGPPRDPTVDVHAVEGGDVTSLLRGLAEESVGDLMWFRPDQWRLPVTREIDEMVRTLVASGRRSRAIYPARVLEEAPEVVRSCAEAGELVRIVGLVPGRISVMGSTAAVLSDRWGAGSPRRLVVREPALVGALGALFESLWDRAMAVPGMDLGFDPAGQRRLLLHQLTRGAKDEQIARTLGVSLRTVRRRVAEIMDDLGAESRFQAGVEAVRRGWL